MSISVMIGDDHRMVANLLARQLDSLQGINVVDVSFTAKEVYERTIELTPDVLVLDVKIPGGLEGPEIAEWILKTRPELPILALSAESNRESVAAMFAAGAMGYVTKDDEVEELARGIRKVHAGGRFLGETVAHDVIRDFILPSKAADPVCFGIGINGGLNQYVAFKNAPTKYRDPSGWAACDAAANGLSFLWDNYLLPVCRPLYGLYLRGMGIDDHYGWPAATFTPSELGISDNWGVTVFVLDDGPFNFARPREPMNPVSYSASGLREIAIVEGLEYFFDAPVLTDEPEPSIDVNVPQFDYNRFFVTVNVHTPPQSSTLQQVMKASVFVGAGAIYTF